MFKDFYDHVRSVFLVIQWGVDASFIHIYYIAYLKIMSYSFDIFASIIDVDLPLIYYSYNLPINGWCEVEYNVYTKYSLA